MVSRSLSAVPQRPLEQHELARVRASAPAAGDLGTGKFGPIDALIREPFRTRTSVGAQHPERDTIDMPTRAHGVLDACASKAHGRAVDELVENLGQRRHVVDQRFPAVAFRQTVESGASLRHQRLDRLHGTAIVRAIEVDRYLWIEGASPAADLYGGFEDLGKVRDRGHAAPAGCFERDV